MENYKILGQNQVSGVSSQSVAFLVGSTSEFTPIAAYSANGITWTEVNLPADNLRTGYGNGKFVAHSSYPLSSYYSIDLITWTQGSYSSSYPGDWSSVAYGNGRFIALPQYGIDGAYSTDGITWTNATLPADLEWTSVTYADNKFVAVAGNSIAVYYSTDAITWASTTISEVQGQGFSSVAYGDGKFVAVQRQFLNEGETNYNTSEFVYSTNGISWTRSTMPINGHWGSIAYGNDRFVALVYSGTVVAAYSTNGIVWSGGSNALAVNTNILVYGGGKFITGGFYGTNYSTDGITWTAASLPGTMFTNRGTAGLLEIASPFTQYTVPSATQASISSISVINNDSVSHTYSVGIVKASDTATAGITATQTIIPTRTIEPGVVDEIVGGITLSAGDQIRTNSDSTDLTVHVYGVEIS